MKKLIVLVGPPSSGKTPYTNEFISKQPDKWVRISQDDQGRKGHKEEFTKALEAGHSIIIDRMGFNKEQRQRYVEPAKELGYSTEIVLLSFSIKSKLIERCMGRKDHPTIKTIEDATRAVNFFFNNYEYVDHSEADEITFIENKEFGYL